MHGEVPTSGVQPLPGPRKHFIYIFVWPVVNLLSFVKEKSRFVRFLCCMCVSSLRRVNQ
jgi:hypothetical protein